MRVRKRMIPFALTRMWYLSCGPAANKLSVHKAISQRNRLGALLKMKINLRNCRAAVLAAVVLPFLAAQLRAAEFTLDNDQVAFTCNTKGGRLLPDSVRDKKTGQVVKLGADLFSLVLTNAAILHSGDFKLAGKPHVAPLPVNPSASRFAERLPGKELVAELVSSDGN